MAAPDGARIDSPAFVKRPGVVAFVLAVLTWAVYYQVWDFQFVHFDDATYVFSNPHVTSGLRRDNVRWAWNWESCHAGIWHPLTWLSLQLDAELYGDFAGGYHVTNVLLHTLNVVLLYLWLTDVTGLVWPSAFVAAAFAIHPLHVESVAWVAERKDVLSTLFGLLCMRSYSKYTRGLKWWRYGIVVVFFAASLLSKPMLVTLPVLLLLLDGWPLKRIGSWPSETMGKSDRGTRRPVSSLIVEKVPLFLISAGFSVVAVLSQRSAGAMMSLAERSAADRLANAGVSYVKYLQMTVWPTNLACFYPIRETYSAGPVAAAWGTLVAISVIAIVWRRRHPSVVVGWAWYLVTLSPVIGLFQIGWQALADRYTYIPSIGLLIAVAWLFADLGERRRFVGAGLAVVSCAVLAGWAVVAWRQTGYWRDSLTLCRRAIEATENNGTAHAHMGLLLYQLGDFAGAEPHFDEALRIAPEDVTARHNYACMLAQEGRDAEAVSEFETILKSHPNHLSTLINLATVYYRQNRLEKSAETARRAVALQPDNVEAHYLLSLILARLGQYEESQKHERIV